LLPAHLLALLRKAFLFAAFLTPGLLQAAPERVSSEQVEVRLIAERNSVEPGSKVLIGLEQKIIPHWHTYWQNPGDSGIPTSIAWQLPEGATAGSILWPVPSRHKQGVLTNYGYSDRVLLLTSVQVPSNAKPGSSFPISAKANWLVCEEVCIPQQAELGLTLKVVDKAARLTERFRTPMPPCPKTHRGQRQSVTPKTKSSCASAVPS
jgi:thiol:disulfide interchange protein DsbD